MLLFYSPSIASIAYDDLLSLSSCRIIDTIFKQTNEAILVKTIGPELISESFKYALTQYEDAHGRIACNFPATLDMHTSL